MKKNILVTGGSGMVGNAMKKWELPQYNYRYASRAAPLPRILGHNTEPGYELCHAESVYKLFETVQPDIIIHLAAQVGGIQDNMHHQAEYYENNVLMNTLVISEARHFGVTKLIALASTCMYPDIAKSYPLTEDQIHDGPPAETNFTYGYSKRAMAVQIDACNKQYGTNYCYLIASNMYGPGDKYENSKSHFVAALIKKIYQAKQSGADHIILYGTGKPIRQFMFCDDVAHLISKFIESDIYKSMNVCPDNSYTIDEIARTALSACDAQHLQIRYDESMPDGQYRKDASNALQQKLITGFNYTSLSLGIKKTYEDFCKNVDKYL